MSLTWADHATLGHPLEPSRSEFRPVYSESSHNLSFQQRIPQKIIRPFETRKRDISNRHCPMQLGSMKSASSMYTFAITKMFLSSDVPQYRLLCQSLFRCPTLYVDGVCSIHWVDCTPPSIPSQTVLIRGSELSRAACIVYNPGTQVIPFISDSSNRRDPGRPKRLNAYFLGPLPVLRIWRSRRSAAS